MRLADFETVSLGVSGPDYFEGFGVADRNDYDHCVIGTGDTEQEALDDAIEQLAQAGCDDFDEEAIHDDYGFPDECVAEGEQRHYVAIMYNDRDEQRLERIKALGVEPLRYSEYTNTVADGDAWYGDFEKADWDHGGALYFFMPFCSGSDDSGSTVEACNHRVFLEEYEYDWVHNVHGGYGTYAVALCVEGLLACDDDVFEEVCDVIEGLYIYAVIDEDKLSKYESERADEAWDNWACDDFALAVEKRFNIDLDVPSSVLRGLFEECADRAGCYWESEGPDVYIDVERVAKEVKPEDIAGWIV